MYVNNKPLCKHSKKELKDIAINIGFREIGLTYLYYELKKKELVNAIELVDDFKNNGTISNTVITKTFADGSSVTYTINDLRNPYERIKKTSHLQHNTKNFMPGIEGIKYLLDKLYNDLYDQSIATGQYANMINRKNNEYRTNLRRNKTLNEIKALGDEATIFKYCFLK